jgi:hypothetical protein
MAIEEGTFHDYGGAVFNVKHSEFGAKGDARSFSASASGSTLTSSTGAFTGADMGKVVSIPGAGPGGRALVTTVTYSSATTLTLAQSVTASVSGVTAVLGTDDRAAIQEAWDRAAGLLANQSPGEAGARCYLPQGRYLIRAPEPVVQTGVSIQFEAASGDDYLRGSGLAAFKDAVLLVVTGASTAANNRTYRVRGVAEDGSHLRVDGPVVNATEAVTLTGWAPALHLRAATVSKERQPLLEGAARGVTLEAALSPVAPRQLPVVVIDNWQEVNPDSGPTEYRLTDNQRGMGVHNLRISNTCAGIAGTGADAFRHDYFGTGVLVRTGWTGQFLKNFQVRGFYVGLDCYNYYHAEMAAGEVRDCNFGLWSSHNANGTSYRDIVVRDIEPALTVESHVSATHFPQGRVGAAIYLAGGTLNAVVFENVSTELCRTVGIYVGGGTPHGVTFVGHRSESVFAPIYARGPGAEHGFSTGFVFINPHLDCDSLGAPAIYLDAVRNYTIINPRLYQRAERGWAASRAYGAGANVVPTGTFANLAYFASAAGTSGTTEPAWPTTPGATVTDGTLTWTAVAIPPVHMTENASGNLIVNPVDGDGGAAGDLIDAIVDEGPDNRVEEPARYLVRAYRTTAASYNSGSTGAITWTGASPNDHGMWSSVSDSTRTPAQIVIPRDGLYQIVASVAWQGDPDGSRHLDIRVGTEVHASVRHAAAGSDSTLQQCVLVTQLQKGDKVSTYVSHTAGNSLDLVSALPYAPRLTVVRLR